MISAQKKQLNPLEKALHERALAVAKKHREVESELLEILLKLDEKKVFRTLGYPSLFQYALSELKLSEATAYNFITVARKAREIPEMKTEIKLGNLSVSKAKKIVPVITKANSSVWLEKAKTLPKRILEQEVAKIAPQVLTPEKSKYVAEKRLSIQCGVSEEVFEKLSRVKDILSQKMKRAVSLEEALAAMADLYLEKCDPVEKAKRAVTRKETQEVTTSELVPGLVEQGKTIPSAVRHEIFLRDEGKCKASLPSGEPCGQGRWLEMHHIVPKSLGGKHSEENLTLLCTHHHKAMHAT